MGGTKKIRIAVSDLQLGCISSADIFDENGLLLLARGQSFDASMRESFAARSIEFLEVDPRDAARLTGSSPSAGTAKPKHRPVSPPDAVPRRTDRTGQAYSADRAKKFRGQIANAAAAIYVTADRIGNLGFDDLKELCGIPAGLLAMMTDDTDQAVAVANESDDPEFFLARRCVRMSMLAIGTGIEMEWNTQNILNLGTAGLLHDLGLFTMNARFRKPDVSLTHEESWEYQRHPLIAADRLADHSIISDEVRVIIAQVHETYDGAGYPRGVKRHLINPLARVLHLIDRYLTLTGPGPGRPPIASPDAMRLLQNGQNAACFEPEHLDGLIRHLGTFPTGTNVTLDDGRTATVLRQDDRSADRPLLRIDNPQGETLSLRQSPHHIVGLTPQPETSQLRLTDDQLDTIDIRSFEPC